MTRSGSAAACRSPVPWKIPGFRLLIMVECPPSRQAMRSEWIAFYEGQYHLVVRFVMKYGASLEDACDAAGEAFLDAWALLQRQPGGWSQIRDRRGWIRKVALRKYQRPPGSRRRPLTSDAKIPDTPAAGPEPGELTAQTQAVLQALRSLDPVARAVMAFRMDGFPTAAIAEAMEISEQKVRDVTKRARAVLKRLLAQLLDGGNNDDRQRAGQHQRAN